MSDSPFIIAEIGSNFKTLKDAMQSILWFAKAGADAVKFQMFYSQELYGDQDYTLGGIHPEWLPELKSVADKAGTEFMCTAFGPTGVAAVNEYVNYHKIASAEMCHVRILDAVNATRKPVFLSTAAKGKWDVKQSLDRLKDCDVTLLYCVGSYPANDIDFRHMEELKKFSVPVGYSDHSTDIRNIPKLALDHGAVVIEKHVTAFPDLNTPDRPHSLTLDEFKTMVKVLRGTDEFVWGTPSESDFISKHNRRLIATRDIEVGSTLREGDNFGIYRAKNAEYEAMSPFMVDRVENAKVYSRITAFTGITAKHLEPR